MIYTYQDRQNYQKQSPTYTGSEFGPNFFDLKKDRDEAIVRFAYSSPEEFNLFTVHHTQINGKWRNIDCLNTPYTTDKCPLCTSGDKPNRRFFIKLIQYIKKEDGTIGIQPKIWERSESYADKLNNLFKEYGDISDCIFKIVRNGDKGDVKTRYDIMYASPAIYKPELYPKDFSSFNNFNFSSFFVLNKNAEEMENILNPNAEPTQPQVQPLPQTQIQPQVQPQIQQPINQPQANTYNGFNQQEPFNNQPNNMGPAPQRRTYDF